MITIFTYRCFCDLKFQALHSGKGGVNCLRALEGSGKRTIFTMLLRAICIDATTHTHTVNASTSLHTQCCSQPWTGCCMEAAALLDSNSTTNTDHAQCVQEARRQLYQEAASPPASPVVSQVVNPNPNLVFSQVEDSVVHSVEKGANCSLSKKQRVRCVQDSRVIGHLGQAEWNIFSPVKACTPQPRATPLHAD